ncbi:ankyrin repeat-containing domain protein [Hypoxylon cercidicola]|nr:ankyrin repeat-containing domain protein [Hypoxylon cercidicola]
MSCSPESIKIETLENAFGGSDSSTNLYERITESSPRGGENSDASVIDVVHVASLGSMDDRHKASDPFALTDNRMWRELMFQSNLSSFLSGDLVGESVQQEALCLLRDLVSARRRVTEVSVVCRCKNSQLTSVWDTRSAIVFVAYDLGALVVKQALCIAAEFQSEYSSIFWDTSIVIFSGCPQRSIHSWNMILKLGAFLSGRLDGNSQRLVIPQVKENLAHITIRTSEEFIASKIGLRAHIIHLYAGDSEAGMIHPSMYAFTATMGLYSEMAIEEQTSDDFASRFPGLCNTIAAYGLKISHPDCLPIEQTLLALVAPPRIFHLDPRETIALQPVLDAQELIDCDNVPGPQILHIRGSSRRLTHITADQIMLRGKARLRQRTYASPVGYLSFIFDSRDPRRRSIPDMVTSVLVQGIYSIPKGTFSSPFHLLRDLFHMRGGWTAKSSISVFDLILTRFFPLGATIILHDFDECNWDSRRAFLNYYSTLANKTEYPLKFVITSREPNSLTAELTQWPQLDVDVYVTDFMSETRSFIADLIQLCPSEPSRRDIQEHLDRLSAITSTNLRTILRLLVDHTGWPDNPSRHSISQFTHLLSLISPSDTPERVLDKIIRADKNTDQLRWVLGWLLCSYRPLSLQELATVVQCYEFKTTSLESSVPLALTRPPLAALQRMRSRLRMLADFRDDQATIHPEIRSLLVSNTDSDSYIWNEVADDAPQQLAEFCLACLKLDRAAALLEDTVLQFESALQKQQQRSLPHHLSKCPYSYRTNAMSFFFDTPTASVSTLWAKTYWAMSSPLSRTTTLPVSALPVCAGLGFLSFEQLNTEIEDMWMQCMSSTIVSGKGNEVLNYLPTRKFAVSTYMELLLSALQANDQNTALGLAQYVLSHPEWSIDSQAWPHSAIWIATWLGMVELSRLLIENGIGIETEPDVNLTLGYHPSVLYLASMLDHAAIVEMLFDRGAISKSPGPTEYEGFRNAAARGHIDVVQKYLNHDPSHIKDRQSRTALYAAAEWGCWHSVSALIQAGAEVNEPQGHPHGDSRTWTPLAIACRNGFPKTVEALLVGGADANAIGPYGVDTALWFPVIDEPNVECVKILLRHEANPNHDLFEIPLLVEMAERSYDSTHLLPLCDALFHGVQPINLNAINDAGQTALMIASQSGKLDLVQWLLTSGADTNVLDRNNKYALYYATRNAHIDVVDALLQKGAKMDLVHASGEEPLLFNAISCPEIMRLLLDSGADANLVSSQGKTALNMASRYGMVEVAKILLEKGADINHKDRYGWAPIFDAVGYCPNVALTRLLAENGAEMDDMVHDETILHLALGEDIEILKTLLESRKGFDINTVDKTGLTALHSAVYESDINYMQVLIRAGADLNKPDRDGETPLHDAAQEAETLDHLKLLLAQPDIDLDAPCPKWGSPLCIASRTLNVEGVRALLDRGADANFTSPNIYLPTPLMSVLGTDRCIDGRTRSEHILTIDVISRMLVLHSTSEANVKQTVPGGIFHTALAAACISAGPATLKFLLEEGAEANLADVVSGRLPHHFAAINGLDNFQAISHSYQGDLMAPDKEQKNCLHWAAQFGNLKTVEFIISRLTNDGSLSLYINRPDSDGWTPLCWAARRWHRAWLYRMRSEQPDFMGVITKLLQNGAQPDVKCKLGRGADTQGLTPVDLARRCQADDGIVAILNHRAEDRTEFEQSVPIYAFHGDVICGICLNPIFGAVFKCNNCADYKICTKCLPHIGTFHTQEILGDGKEHELERDAEYREYRDMPDGQGKNGDELVSSEQVADGERDDERNGEACEGSSEWEEEMVDLDGIDFFEVLGSNASLDRRL